MKLENIDDVLKQNVSKDCSVRWLAARILHCDDYSKLYESCRNYDEFEKRVLNKECCLNDIYSAISMYGKDRINHWYRIRELFGDRCFKTASDVGSLLVGNEEFQVLIPNGYGDGTTRVGNGKQIRIFYRGRYNEEHFCLVLLHGINDLL